LIQGAFRHVHVSSSTEITLEFSFVGIKGCRDNQREILTPGKVIVLDTDLFVCLRYDRHRDEDFSDSPASPPAFVAPDQEDSVTRDVVSSDMPPSLKVES
jgi:hypothetical protein